MIISLLSIQSELVKTIYTLEFMMTPFEKLIHLVPEFQMLKKMFTTCGEMMY